jgi:nucleoside-diphosphate-sugar epimerase
VPSPNKTPRSSIVTGSTGFIGSRLSARLRLDGWDTRAWETDVREIARHEEAVDVVFHLAAVLRHDRFDTDPHEAYDVNVTGTQAVLNYCQAVGATCVLTSTSGIYRSGRGASFIQEDAPIGPSLPYAISKWLAESLCQRQAEDRGVPSVALRLFNVYGPGQHASFLVPHVLDCLMEERTLRLRMPEALRDFVYVDDVVDGLVKASAYEQPGFAPFNIGSGEATRVIDFVHLAEEVWGKTATIDIGKPHAGELPSMAADVTRARQELGWTPRHDLRAGLMAMKHSLETASPSRLP